MIVQVIIKAKVNIYRNTIISKVLNENSLIAYNGKEKIKLNFDTIIVCTGFEANQGLINSLNGSPFEVYDIGDCVKPGKVLDAIWDAFRTARLV